MSKINSTKELDKILKNLSKLTKKSVYVGLPKEKINLSAVGYGGLNVAQIGAVHEFGYGISPRRSFLYDTFETKKNDFSKDIQELYRNNVIDTTQKANKFLSKIGIQARNYVIDAFDTSGFGNWQPNSEYTINMKGSSKPLIDTGALKQSITWVVR